MNTTDVQRGLGHLPVLVRGRPLHGPERYRPFFIVGSGRCGTTLMRAVIQARADVDVPPETHVLGALIRDYRRYARLPWTAVLRLVLGRLEYHHEWEAFELSLGSVYRDAANWPPEERNLAAVLNSVYRAHAAAHKPSATRWGDKTPTNVECLAELRRVFPDMHVIHVVRDGRDVVASFLRLGQLDLERAADRWLRAIRAARAFARRHQEHCLEVRYETLVSEPADVIRDVCAFLGLAFDDRMLRHHTVGLRLADVEHRPHLQGVRSAIHTDAVGTWGSYLTPRQIDKLEGRIGRELRELGYQLTDGC